MGEHAKDEQGTLSPDSSYSSRGLEGATLQGLHSSSISEVADWKD